jgi:polyferredoxin
VSVKTLDLVSSLGKAAHFPNENHEMLQGLLMKYRTAIGHFEDRLLERWVGTRMGVVCVDMYVCMYVYTYVCRYVCTYGMLQGLLMKYRTAIGHFEDRLLERSVCACVCVCVCRESVYLRNSCNQ